MVLLTFPYPPNPTNLCLESRPCSGDCHLYPHRCAKASPWKDNHTHHPYWRLLVAGRRWIVQASEYGRVFSTSSATLNRITVGSPESMVSSYGLFANESQCQKGRESVEVGPSRWPKSSFPGLLLPRARRPSQTPRILQRFASLGSRS